MRIRWLIGILTVNVGIGFLAGVTGANLELPYQDWDWYRYHPYYQPPSGHDRLVWRRWTEQNRRRWEREDAKKRQPTRRKR